MTEIRLTKLINSAQTVLKNNQQHSSPFAIFTFRNITEIRELPIVKPLLVFLLSGRKEIKGEVDTICTAGHFLFLSNKFGVDMRIIPSEHECFALGIEFEFEDFDIFTNKPRLESNPIIGEIDLVLENTLNQYLEWVSFTSPDLWPSRKQEILKVLYQQGYTQVSAITQLSSLSHKVFYILNSFVSEDLKADFVSSKLGMSEPTLRRKLKREGTSFIEIKDRVRLGLGFRLIQTSDYPIREVSEKCGYKSQSQFTEKFKSQFGTTPTFLRKTRMPI